MVLVSAILPLILGAARRTSAAVHEEMRQGLPGLATIAVLAPWVGILGWIWSMLNSFPGVTGSAVSLFAVVTGNISNSMWPAALGLLVGITALLCYRYLTERLQSMDHEMEDACLALVASLRRQRGWFKLGAAADSPLLGEMFGEMSQFELEKDRKFLRRSVFVAAAALLVAWFVQAIRYFCGAGVPLQPSVQDSFIYVLFTFGLSCLLVHAAWVKLLHRRRGGLVVLGSLVCLCWSVAEFVAGRHLP